MNTFPELVAPYTRVVTIHDDTDLPTTPTLDALDARYSAAGIVVSATTTVQGIVELATTAEATTGTDTTRAVTPAGLSAALGAVGATRTTAGYTTASLANGAQELSTVDLAASFDLFTLQADRACRVRLYDTTTHRGADSARAVGTLPTDTSSDHGCFLEVIFSGSGTQTLTAGAAGFVPTGIAVPITVTNLSGSTHTVALTFTYLPKE